MVLVNNLQRHKALARVRHRDGHRPRVEVEHGERIERVAIKANDRLIIDARRLTVMLELSQTSFFEKITDIGVGLGTGKVIQRDRHGDARW